MKKVREADLEAKIKGIIDGGGEAPEKDIVRLLKELQDASGLKVCQQVPKEDFAYREVK